MRDDIREPQRPSTPVDRKPKPDPDEATFIPPEAVAQQEEILVDMATEGTKPAKADKKPKDAGKKKASKLKDAWADFLIWWNDRSKKQKIILAGAAAGVIIGIGLGLFFLLHKSKPAPKVEAPVVKQEEKKEPPKPTTEASRLTGVQVAPEYNQLPVTGIMIENSPDARPQSGLSQAGVVFEAIAEGGITRFLTLWQEAQPDYVGPVRSVRPYYLQWLQGFDAAVAHVGGSAVALAMIKTNGIKDLDQFYNGGAYQRISARYAPHNVYTSLGSLLALQKSKGFTSSNYTGFARKEEKPVTAAPTAKSINMVISSALYNAHYDYDTASNSYLRSEGGLPHMDEKSGQQIKPKVVIAIVVPQGIDPDGLHTSYNVLGNGKAYIFQDGTVTIGTWSKSSDKEQIRFGDANGSPLGLNPGQTWISVVGDANNVTYTP